jgi:formyltetrahydrofolate-dependent phosphoribosylglycinamide formyltransferase
MTETRTGSGVLRIGVCVSGGGTTLQNLIDRIGAGTLGAEIGVVVASRPAIGAIARAGRASIPVQVIERKGRAVGDFSNEVFAAVRSHQVELVVLGGFLSLLEIPDDFAGRVINVHPSLIPAFAGRGFHGERVHEAAIALGVKVSGCTVHFADNTYDTGPIILQRVVPVLEDDRPPDLAARVFEAECEALPDAIRLFAEGRLCVDGQHVRIREKQST